MKNEIPNEALREALLNDPDLEAFYGKSNKLRFYCCGSFFLAVSKEGVPIKKHMHKEYFSEDAASEKRIFIDVNEKDPADMERIYRPGSTVYNASKEALRNRAEGRLPSKPKSYLERLYQQTIARNNRPGPDRDLGVADFSFTIPERIFRENPKAGITKEGKAQTTSVDMVFVDETARKIAFIEYKQGADAWVGDSGLNEHCAKTLLCMDNEEVKIWALTRYFAKKALHGGMPPASMRVWKKEAKSIAQEYDSVCVFLFTDVAQNEVCSALKKLKSSERTINQLMGMYSMSTVEGPIAWDRVRYIHCESYENATLSHVAWMELP